MSSTFENILSESFTDKVLNITTLSSKITSDGAYTNHLATLLAKQLYVDELTITTSSDSLPSATSQVGNSVTTAYKFEGTLSTSTKKLLNTDVDGTANFYIWLDGTKVQAMLVTKISQSGWSFANSFPLLAPGGTNYSVVFANLTASDNPVLAVATTTIDSVSLSFNSLTDKSIQENINVFFEADISSTIQSLYKGLSIFNTLTGIKLSTALSFQGTIDNSQSVTTQNAQQQSVTNHYPVIQVRSDSTATNNSGSTAVDKILQALHLSIGFETTYTSVPANEEEDTPAVNFLSTNVDFYITLPKDIMLKAAIPTLSASLINVSLVVEEQHPVTLKDVSKLFTPLKSLSSQLPSFFGTIAESVDITAFGFSLDVTTPAISLLNVSFEIDKVADLIAPSNDSETIIADFINPQTLTFTFIINSPFSSPTYTVLFSGTANFLSIESGTNTNAEFQASYDSESHELSFSGGLTDAIAFSDLTKNKNKNLSSQLSTFATDVNKGLEDIDLSTLQIDALGFAATYNISSEDYSLEFNFSAEDDSWKIGGVTVASLELGGTYDSTASPTFQPNFSILFDIAYPVATGAAAGSNGAATVILTGDYDDDDKWSFSGGLGGGGLTFKELMVAFGVTTAPAWFNDLDLIDLSVTYKEADGFTLTTDANLELGSTSITFDLTITYKDSDLSISGSLSLNAYTFNIVSSAGQHLDTLTVSLINHPQNISLTTLIKLFSPNIAQELSVFTTALSISELTFSYASANPTADPKTYGQFALGIKDAEYGDLVVAGAKSSAGTWYYAFVLNFTATIDFADLPLVGSFIKDHGGFSINPLSFTVVPQSIAENAVAFLSMDGYPSLPDATSAAIPKEVAIGLTATIDGQPKVIKLDAKAPATPLPAASGGETTTNSEKSESEKTDKQTTTTSSNLPTAASQNTVKSFGPVTIQKYAVSYHHSELNLDVSGSLSLGGIGLSLEGLSIGVPFPPTSKETWIFSLQGLGVDVQKGPLTIAGGFMDVGSSDYMGAVDIQAGEFGLQAYGGYQHEANGDASFFIFVNADFPIGGPPFFFVDGIAGGFGINRSFKLPTTFKGLSNYPLLPGSKSPIPASVTQSPNGMQALSKVLTNLASYIHPEAGNYWVAAGLDVTSFEMINVEAVLSVSFGVDLEIALMGSANMTLPIAEDPDPIAYIAINFRIAISPEKGLFSAMGVLTPASYVYMPEIHLSGGFAFDIWFAGSEYEGDFVVSIGGYNPSYQKPAHYPSVPRLELSWSSGGLSMDGQGYFALTPKMMMAGLSLNASWHGGPAKAWFNAGVDFLIGWKPFHYEAGIYIHVGGSVHILFTITVHVGANLSIWGPPFGGKAHIDLSVFSFTIYFGQGQTPPPPISWSAFKELLPNSYPTPTSSEWALSTIQLTQGLIKQLSTTVLTAALPDATVLKSSAGGSASSDLSSAALNWVIDPDHFEFTIHSTAPLSNYAFNDVLQGSDSDDWYKVGTLLGMAPMNVLASDFISTLNISLAYIDGSGIVSYVKEDFVFQIQTKAVPNALWGGDGDGSGKLNSETLTSGALTKIIILPPVWSPAYTNAIAIAKLLLAQNKTSFTWPTPPGVANSGITTGSVATYEDRTTLTLTASSFTNLDESNTDIIDDLKHDFSWLDLEASATDLEAIAFQDLPILCTLGAKASNADSTYIS